MKLSTASLSKQGKQPKPRLGKEKKKWLDLKQINLSPRLTCKTVTSLHQYTFLIVPVTQHSTLNTKFYSILSNRLQCFNYLPCLPRFSLALHPRPWLFTNLQLTMNLALDLHGPGMTLFQANIPATGINPAWPLVSCSELQILRAAVVHTYLVSSCRILEDNRGEGAKPGHRLEV